MMKILIVLAMTAMVSACATSTYEQGRDFSDASVENIVKNQTTIDDVKKVFGEPSTIINGTDDTITWGYMYVNSTAHAQSKIFTMDVKSSVKSKSLTIVFRSGVVASYTYSHSGTPGTMETKMQ